MSGSLLGMIAAAASLVACLVCGIIVLVRAFGVKRTAAKLSARPAAFSLQGLPEKAQQITMAFGQLQGVGGRFGAVNRDVLSVAASGAQFAADVKLVAVATESLLDALIPSMRGSMQPQLDPSRH